MKILFIEDEKYYQEAYGAPLEQAGHAVTYADNGEDAQKLLKKKKFDLLIVDLIMPIMSGRRFLESLRSGKASIVVLTNLEGETDREDCLAAGADLFLMKSEVSPKDLAAKIAKMKKGGKKEKK